VAVFREGLRLMQLASHVFLVAINHFADRLEHFQLRPQKTLSTKQVWFQALMVLGVEHNHFFFLVPRSIKKLAASTQALITLGSPSRHPAHPEPPKLPQLPEQSLGIQFNYLELGCFPFLLSPDYTVHDIG